MPVLNHPKWKITQKLWILDRFHAIMIGLTEGIQELSRQTKWWKGTIQEVSGHIICNTVLGSEKTILVKSRRAEMGSIEEIQADAFKRVFTSPSSTDEQPIDSARSAHNRNSGERRTRRDVATLLDMRSVQPRAIAYVSVQRAQLRFALSSSGSWRIIDDEFNNQEFYDNIVDYLELPPTPEAAKEIDNLLLWWNQKIFGRRFVSNYCPQQANKMSVAMTLDKKARPLA
ncbi:hypothetical protein F4604DRAFT_1675484 [Suillus subluteus]|nr:hypothetical protein F4604DRAFT_1675484 [Suillus subluteus]